MSRGNEDQNKISDVLKQFVETNKLQKGLDKVNVKETWHQVMGNGVSNYTSNVILIGNTLHVVLNSSVLREELSYGKEKIVTMLNEALGKELITSIVLR